MRATRREARAPLTADEEAFLGSLLRDGAFEFSRTGLGTDLVSGVVRFLNASEQLQAKLTKQLAGVIGERRNRVWLIAGGALSLAWVALVGYLHAAAETPTVEVGAADAGGFAIGLVLVTLLFNGAMGGFLGIRRKRFHMYLETAEGDEIEFLSKLRDQAAAIMIRTPSQQGQSSAESVVHASQSAGRKLADLFNELAAIERGHLVAQSNALFRQPATPFGERDGGRPPALFRRGGGERYHDD